MGYGNRSAYVISWLSILINCLLFVLKFIVGKHTNSVSITADAWHSLSDSMTSIVVIFSIWIASKPPDREHPFGHGRAGSIGAIIVATILAMVSVELVIDSINSFMMDRYFQYSIYAVWVLVFSILAKEVMAQFSFFIGKKINSNALKADAWHHRTDSISSAIILLGILFGQSLPWLDGALGFSVSILLGYTAYEIIKDSVGNILGEKPEENLKVEIKHIAAELSSDITNVHDFKLHSYGDHKEVSFHMELPQEMTVHDSHEIAHSLEKKILDANKVHATVHIDPKH
jgi:cation diffusion facilitator family transporter